MHLCERCNKPATVHMTEVTDGNLHNRHMCDPCAEEAEWLQRPFSKWRKRFEELHLRLMAAHEQYFADPKDSTEAEIDRSIEALKAFVADESLFGPGKFR